jgi:plastocyanin
MRHRMMKLMSGLLAGSLLAGCSGSNTPTSPSSGGGGGTPPTPPPPMTGQGGGSNSAPSTAAVTIGPGISFMSAHNGSTNPAVDTVAVNGTVTWTWSGSLPHGVQSMGSPSFTNSAIQSGVGKTYQFQFTTPGSYQYDCAVHGTLMTGTIVVMAASGSSSTPAPSTPSPSMPPPPGY